MAADTQNPEIHCSVSGLRFGFGWPTGGKNLGVHHLPALLGIVNALNTKTLSGVFVFEEKSLLPGFPPAVG